MKTISSLMAGTLLFGLASCASESATTPPSVTAPAEGVYSQLSLRLPAATRSAASEGQEIGKDYENNVGSILVVLASEGDTPGTYKFLTYALNDSPLSNTSSSTHTIVFQDRETLYNYAGEQGRNVSVFAYCNPTPELRRTVAGTLNATTGVYEGGMQRDQEFADLVCSAGAEETWSSNGFLMASVSVATAPLPGQAKLREYNTPENALSLGTINVVRTSARFDIRDASPEDTDPFTYIIRDENGTAGADGLKPEVARVKLTRVAMFNRRNEFYYLPRNEANSVTTLCPGMDGMETGVILSPSERSYSENLPARIDPLNPPASLKWFALGQGDEDSDSGWGDNVTPAEDKLGYRIWRYTTENTFPAGTEPEREQTTGYVFESEIIVPEGFGNVADGKKQTMYLYGNKLYPCALAIAAEIERVPVSTLATAFEAAFDVTRGADGKVTAAVPKADDVVENMGFTAYRPDAAGRYLAYYFSFNRHNDDDDVTAYGDMEFATVRNNVYKLAVTSIRRFGSFKPSDKVEEWDTYFTLNVEVRPWVVRINNLKY